MDLNVDSVLDDVTSCGREFCVPVMTFSCYGALEIVSAITIIIIMSVMQHAAAGKARSPVVRRCVERTDSRCR